MQDKILATIKKYHMIELGDHIIIGLSGGADSVCLLWLLNALKEHLGIYLYGMHIHHGLRGEDANEDAVFSEELCKRLEIPFEVIYKDIKKEAKEFKISEEEAGRKARYESFEKKRRKLGKAKIAIAHHMNDQAETVLFNMIRGSGLKGMGGIRPVRDSIIRPLIECSRTQIEEFCHNNSISYRNDPTNRLDIYSRNKLRLHLIPYIEENFNPSFVQQMSTMSEQLREDDLYLAKQANCFLSNYVIKDAPTRRTIEIGKLMELDQVIRKRVYKKIVFEISRSLKDYESKHINQIEELLNKETGKRIHLPNGIIVEKTYNKICFKREESLSFTWEYSLLKDQSSLDIKELKASFHINILENQNFTDFPESRYTKWFDYDKMVSDLTIRNRRQGDFIALKGLNGKKSLKKFFVDEKIPRDKRDQIALLTEGSNVIWIVGYRMNEEYKITKDTQKILEIVYTKEES